ncbi:MAG: helix-turn-helix domain-containing protein [Clostridia bacterium]|nr:helix-turn-helix domain-containing protein [Clostridia bacterium]
MDIERLKKAKAAKKLSYDDIAKLTGYSRSTITNIFCGYIELPRYETVQAIERALGLSWTDEEKTMGVGAHAVVLSEEDAYRLNLLAKAEEVLGISYVTALLTAVEIAIQQKNIK